MVTPEASTTLHTAHTTTFKQAHSMNVLCMALWKGAKFGMKWWCTSQIYEHSHFKKKKHINGLNGTNILKPQLIETAYAQIYLLLIGPIRQAVFNSLYCTSSYVSTASCNIIML
jgi:hypothetical protein